LLSRLDFFINGFFRGCPYAWKFSKPLDLARHGSRVHHILAFVKGIPQYFVVGSASEASKPRSALIIKAPLES
jgi:hypothetical protein